ncbi:hypothetical protein CDAR_540631 [Caerostris darwini]|uniref:Uncharacterized protein n=1 Tax=Caerostris darwini TaxID=1538125 RepID=A0AAV4VP90_9ARAC|nr:hypothetical protein CDAR_540631 [Caerostris darwini]
MPNHRQDQCRKNSSQTLRETLFFLIITSSRLKGHFSLSFRIPIGPHQSTSPITIWRVPLPQFPQKSHLRCLTLGRGEGAGESEKRSVGAVKSGDYLLDLKILSL